MKLKPSTTREIDLAPVTLLELRQRQSHNTLDLLALCGGLVILGLWLLLM